MKCCFCCCCCCCYCYCYCYFWSHNPTIRVWLKLSQEQLRYRWHWVCGGGCCKVKSFSCQTQLFSWVVVELGLWQKGFFNKSQKCKMSGIWEPSSRTFLEKSRTFLRTQRFLDHFSKDGFYIDYNDYQFQHIHTWNTLILTLITINSENFPNKFLLQNLKGQTHFSHF